MLLTFGLAPMTAAAATGDPRPRAVPELSSNDGIAVVAAWTADDHYIVSGSGQQITVWDAMSGAVIDRLTLPEIPNLKLNRLVDISLDGRMLSVRAVVDARALSAPGEQARRVWKVVVFDLNLDDRLPSVRVLADPPGPGDAPVLPSLSGPKVRLEWNRLPDSHDGRKRLMLRNGAAFSASTAAGPRRPDFIVVQDLDRQTLTDLDPPFRAIPGVAIPSPDGQRMLLDIGRGASVVDRFTSRELSRIDARLEWGAATWFGNDHLLAFAVDEAEATYEASQIFSATRGAPVGTIAESVNPVVALTAETFLGAKVYPQDGSKPGILQRFDGRAWTPFGPAEYRGRQAYSLALSPDHHTVVVAYNPTQRPDGSGDAADDGVTVALDAISGRKIAEFSSLHATTSFASDGRSVLVADQRDDALSVWRPGDGPPRRLATGFRGAMESNGRAIVTADGNGLRRRDPVTGADLGGMAFVNLARMGFLEGGRLFWAASATEGIRYWSAEGDWPELFTTLYFLDAQRALHHFTTTPDGRYDSDLGPDTLAFHWIMPDAPFERLAPQTFMRGYYEPRLAARITACTLSRTCASAFPQAPSLAGLNRALPAVRITRVRMGAQWALVEVEAQSIRRRTGADGAPNSGVYDLRLFRDGKLVGQQPAPPADLPTADLPAWRAASGLSPGADGVVRRTFQVPLPTGAAGDMTLTAYAFNADRVKSETAQRVARRDDTPPRARMAYVLAIGEDRYDRNAAWSLNYAAADARRLAARLGAVAGFKVVALPLISDRQTAQGSKTVIRDALALLANPALGATVDRTAALARLRTAGLSETALRGLQTATPDDLVIVSFSGHGWVDHKGGFFLVPSDGGIDAASGAPTPATLISSAELTEWMRTVDAGEMAILIDACHSAASVEAQGFKAGPFGDAGLGQLAFDKQIRILAGAQANAVAMEDPGLGQGLLTYALVREALNDQPEPSVSRGHKPPVDKTGRVPLDAWLRYAAARLPSLSQQISVQRMTPPSRGRDIVFSPPAEAATPPAGQEPTLFDFNRAPSQVRLLPASAAVRRR